MAAQSNRPKPPTELLRELLNISSADEKIKFPQTRRELTEFRERLEVSGLGTPEDYEYIDLVEMAVASGKAEFEEEDN